MVEPSINVSAILTTYRRPDLAQEALKSVITQSHPPDEIIIVEDGGTTGLADWIAALGRDDVTYIRHEDNQGLAATRNTGLHLAKYELIAYLDDDDRWLPTRLQEQVERYRSLAPSQRQQLAAIQVGCKVIDSKGRLIGQVLPLNQGNLRDSIVNQGPATPSSCFMFVRSALLDIGGFDEDLISGIDHDVWMKLAVAGYSNEIIKKPLVVVTRDERHTMMSDTKSRVSGITQYVDKWTPTYKEWFGESGGDVYARKYFINVVCGLAGQKLALGQFRDAYYATKAAVRCAGRRPSLQIFGIGRLLRTFVSRAIPRLGHLKRAIFHQQDT